MKFKKIYDYAPIWFQNIMISIYGNKLRKLRYGKIYQDELERLRNRDISSVEENKAIQNRKFMDLLNYAIINSPFYKEFYKDVDLSLIKSIDDIKLLPILDKETLRSNIDSVFTLKKNEGIVNFTGGTTGKSLNVVFTDGDNQRRLAYLDWFKTVHGFRNGDMRAARFNGKDIIPIGQRAKVFWRDNITIKQRIYSSFYTSPQNLKYYAENLNKFKPEEIDGFCTSICEVANYMEQNNIMPTFTPKAIFPTSETVLQYHRELIERVFKAPLRDQYASSEGAPFIIECKCGKMHECTDTGVFEHIKMDNGEVKLVVTSFSTYGTPLIRYDIGDTIVEAEDQTCECGWAFPIVKSIGGRKADCLYSPERGNINIANLSNVIKSFPNSIVNIQFVQKTENNIVINVVVDKDRYKQTEECLIIKEMVTRFGKNMTFDIVYKDIIPRTKSGKYQFVINELNKK